MAVDLPVCDGDQVTAVCSDVELVTGTRAGQLVKWRCDSGVVVHYLSRDDEAGASWTAHDADIRAVDVLRSRNWLLSASADYTLRIWDLSSNRLLQTLVGHDDQVNRPSH